MCGIIGYTGHREAASILLDGLASLEYRGYDSAGISVMAPSGDVEVRKASGKLESLVMSLQGRLPAGNSGIGHTRWATHGEVNLSNAHPLLDCQDEIVVVHNGIVENYLEIKNELLDQGHTFSSETDSEVIPHLIEDFIGRGVALEEAVRLAALRLTGAHAAVVMCKRDAGKLIAFRVRNAGGILVGYGESEMVLASDLPRHHSPHTVRSCFSPPERW